MDIRRMASVKGASLCTSFTFTPRSPKEELKTRISLWFELRPIAANSTRLRDSQPLKLELNHELPTDHSAFPLGPPGRDAGRTCPVGTDQQVTLGIPVETSARRLGRPRSGRQDGKRVESEVWIPLAEQLPGHPGREALGDHRSRSICDHVALARRVLMFLFSNEFPPFRPSISISVLRRVP